MLNSRTEAYNGRGNYPVKTTSDTRPALVALKIRPLYAEWWAHFKAELAVMVVKIDDKAAVEDWQTATMAFSMVETCP